MGDKTKAARRNPRKEVKKSRMWRGCKQKLRRKEKSEKKREGNEGS